MELYKTNNCITVGSFTEDIMNPIETIMSGNGTRGPFKSRMDLRVWLENNHLKYRTYFEEIVNHFGDRYKLI